MSLVRNQVAAAVAVGVDRAATGNHVDETLRSRIPKAATSLTMSKMTLIVPKRSLARSTTRIGDPVSARAAGAFKFRPGKTLSKGLSPRTSHRERNQVVTAAGGPEVEAVGLVASPARVIGPEPRRSSDFANEPACKSHHDYSAAP